MSINLPRSHHSASAANRILLAALLAIALPSPAAGQPIAAGGPGGPATRPRASAALANPPPNGEPPPPADASVLYLQGDDWLTGEPVASKQSGKFAWQSPAFTRPFEFDPHGLDRVRFPVKAAPAWRECDYRLELAGGDVLYGELLAVSDDNLILRSSAAGELRVKRSAVRCLERCRANTLVYIGPNGLAEWRPAPDAAAWREDAGCLVSDRDGASLYAEIELPAKALVEFEISSLFPPVFRLALGKPEEQGGRRRGFRIEVVDLDVIAVYESETDIDVARVMTLTPGPDRDRVRLRVLLDQEAQRADVYSPEGLSLATVRLANRAPRATSGVSLEHRRGGLRLERLRVWQWSGSLPKPFAGNRPRLHRIDGEVLEGKLAGYDPERRQFVISTERGEEVCGDDQLARIYFDRPAEPPSRPVRVACADGTQLSGWFTSIDAERLSLECLSIDTPKFDSTSLPLAAIASIAFSHEPEAGGKPAEAASVVYLDGGCLHGQLAPAKAESGQSGLSWQPVSSGAASPLRDDASARIVLPAKAPTGRQPIQPSGYDTLYLTTGDTFRCEVTRIDAAGVSCRTTSTKKQISHDKIKAIDLRRSPPRNRADARLSFQEFALQAAAEPTSGPKRASLEHEKLRRLLTLPRLQRDDPPTHIICATNGDYLRGRLQQLTDDVLQFSLGDRDREFPRERIAAIVWLHPEDETPSPDAPSPEAPSPDAALAKQAHAVCTDGTRLTFAVTETDEHVVAGLSDVLGDCRLPRDRLSELFIGGRVPPATALTAYHDWKLTPAPDPKAFQSSGADGAPVGDGRDSSLVGQLAPDFELDLLDGAKFRLSGQKGATVVLDFWASWCAPCVQGLPKLALAVAELDAPDVKLVTVNLRQLPDEVRAALERMKLTVTAALDRDGAVAALYGAAAIPYTVIVAPDGKVARVFIGGGAESEKQVRAALAEMRPAKTSEASRSAKDE